MKSVAHGTQGIPHRGDIFETFVDGGLTTADYPSVNPTDIHQLQDAAKTVYVVPAVGEGSVRLFRGDKSLSSGRLFKHGIAIGISKSEVDKFHVLSVARYHNILRLQVAVNHLPLVYKFHGIKKLRKNAAFLLTRVVQGEPMIQGKSVNPFHYDTLAVSVDILHSIDINDVMTFNIFKNIILLMQ